MPTTRSPIDARPGALHGLIIDDWRPTSLNQLMHCHWTKKHRLKKRDAELFAVLAAAQQIPRATGKRRVSLRIVLSGRQRIQDEDNIWKSLLDALVRCGLLLDDNAAGVERGPVRWERGAKTRTEIIIENLGE